MIIKVNDNGTIKSCNVPDVSDIPTKISDLTNDSGYLTEHQDISGKANITDLATIATSGNYNDLSNKPNIPTKISDLTDDSGHYVKPVNGIPASDLANGVIPDLPIARGVGTDSVIIGDITNNIASHLYSYAEGGNTTASGNNAHSEGYSTQASGDQSHAEGGTTTASGLNSHAEGGGTTSSGSQSHAEGAGTVASGECAHAEGWHTEVPGYFSHAEGSYTIAASQNQHVQGKYNVSDTNNTYAHIVGGGSSTNSRRNIQTLDWNGNEAITGSLTIGKDTANEVEITPSLIKPLITTVLPASADLNSYIAPGNYTADSTVIASITHAPTTTVEYKLIVEQISDEVIKQTIITTETPANVYQRTGDSSGINWIFGDWVKEIKSTDYATTAKAGLVKVNGAGVQMVGDRIAILPSTSAQIKAGTASYEPIGPALQHEATFYGLAKAAGDTTQSSSNNVVGIYTDEAKVAIQQMLGIGSISINVITVSETSPIIIGEANTRYNCGEVISLNLTPPSVGTMDIRFTSGSTVTTLTVPNTIKFPEWFDPSSLEVNTIYEICIIDGIYAGVTSWAL